MTTARYDRQLRIWGAHGQRRLESARICVLNSGPCATETLKNLVLGGIEGFELVDDEMVGEEEFGRNYFVRREGMGKGRAEGACELLKELNESVGGMVRHESVKELIHERREFFNGFHFVIATQLRKPEMKKLIEICDSFEIPLICVRSYGLLGMMQVYVKESCVVESKPEDEVPDLRLADAWPELLQFADSLDFDQLDDVQHSHVPYIVILLKAATIWRASSSEGKALPSTSADKTAFRAVIQQLRRTEKKTAVEEENFDEATRAAYQFWTPYSIPSTVQAILDDDCTDVTTKSSKFWIVAAALKQFVQECHVLPLNGSIPDMTATTEFYLQLQHIYNARAQEDMETVSAYVKEILQRLQLPSEHISKEDVALMCKNARNLRLVRSWPNFLSEDPHLFSHLRNPETFRNTSFALLLEAVDVFYQTHARDPGVQLSEAWSEDAHLLMKATQELVDLTRLEQELQSEIQSMALEICRFGAGELHNVSAVMGGIVAQEAIKHLTHQFVPFKGTLLYNAMDSTTTPL